MRSQSRVLIYSHDSMGLGHLRRCRAIAHALVDADPHLSVLILSGSPIIGSFDFRNRVDFVRVPGVIKLRNGSYTSLNLPLRIEETLEIRAEIMRHTAAIFDPDLFIVDKEPLGLRGEVRPTLELSRRERGRPSAPGLRDVMDDAAQLESEWARKNVMPALTTLYDQIWVYGVEAFCDPLDGLPVPAGIRARMRYTGYLRRSPPRSTGAASVPVPEEPYLLVTPGGGGDGETLIDWVLSAYEAATDLPPAVIVFGPFMSAETQAGFRARMTSLPKLVGLSFDAHPERLMQAAAGVVAMGGYNTFCEILSFDRPAIVVPRTEPRLEQFIRAERAEALGMLRMLPDDGRRDPLVMAEALRRLPEQAPPSAKLLPGLLDGIEVVNGLAQQLIRRAAVPTRGSRPLLRLLGGE